MSQNFSIATFLILDYVSLLPNEMQYIWKAQFNFGKVLYLLIRYLVFIDVSLNFVTSAFRISPSACKGFVTAQDWLFVIGVGFTCIMLSLRTWIIWLRNRHVLYFLSALFCIIWSLLFYFLSRFPVIVHYDTIESPLRGCFNGQQREQRVLQIPIPVLIAAFETVLIVMTWTRILRDRKLGFEKTRSPVVTILYQDVFLNRVYFLVLFTAILLPFGTTSSNQNLLSWQRLAHSLLGSKMLLNLRMANEGRTPPPPPIYLFPTLRSLIKHAYNNSRMTEKPGNQDGKPISVSIPSGFMDIVTRDVESWFAPDPAIYPGHVNVEIPPLGRRASLSLGTLDRVERGSGCGESMNESEREADSEGGSLKDFDSTS